MHDFATPRSGAETTVSQAPRATIATVQATSGDARNRDRLTSHGQTPPLLFPPARPPARADLPGTHAMPRDFASRCRHCGRSPAYSAVAEDRPRAREGRRVATRGDCVVQRAPAP